MKRKRIIGSKKRIKIVPPLSNFPSRREWEDAVWRRVMRSRNMMRLLVTSHERHDIVMRAATLEALAAGTPQRQISRDFFVSLQTINAVKKAMRDSGYRSYLDRSKTERKKREMNTISLIPKKRSSMPRRTKYGVVYLP